MPPECLFAALFSREGALPAALRQTRMGRSVYRTLVPPSQPDEHTLSNGKVFINCGSGGVNIPIAHLPFSDATLAVCSGLFFLSVRASWKVTASVPITMEFEHITTDKAALKRE